jgi:hypothetical protein
MGRKKKWKEIKEVKNWEVWENKKVEWKVEVNKVKVEKKIWVGVIKN